MGLGGATLHVWRFAVGLRPSAEAHRSGLQAEPCTPLTAQAATVGDGHAQHATYGIRASAAQGSGL